MIALIGSAEQAHRFAHYHQLKGDQYRVVSKFTDVFGKYYFTTYLETYNYEALLNVKEHRRIVDYLEAHGAVRNTNLR